MKQKERKKGSSTLENYELPLNNPYSISSDIQTTSAAFNVFEDEDEDEDLDLNGNIGSKMLTKTIHKKKTSLLSRNVTAEIKVSLIISSLYYNFYFYNL